MSGIINPGQFSLGPLNSVSIFDTLTNTEMVWGLETLINFDSSPVNNRKQINLMQGITEDLVFDQGWKGEFTIQRTNNNLDTYWSAMEALVRLGGTRPTWTIIQNIRETTGVNTQNTFQVCAITYDMAGTWANEEGVVQKLSFTSPARNSVPL